MLIDAHIHLYPPSVYSDPRAWAKGRGESYWLSCVAPERGPTLQGWADVDQLLRDMDNAGIEKAIILGWYWQNHDTCIENLKWQIDWIQDHPDRLLAYAAFNPNGGADSLDMLDRAFDAGLSGIGELNPPAQGYAYENDTLDKALELAAKCGKAVNFHVTDPTTRDYPGKIETPFESLFSMAQRHPNTTFVFAHLAGMMNLPRLKQLDNVYLDTAATPLLYNDSIYQKAIDQIGADRILFGTDYPLRTFPKRQSKPDFSSHLNALRACGLDPDELERILRKNCSKILSTEFQK